MTSVSQILCVMYNDGKTTRNIFFCFLYMKTPKSSLAGKLQWIAIFKKKRHGQDWLHPIHDGSSEVTLLPLPNEQLAVFTGCFICFDNS